MLKPGTLSVPLRTPVDNYYNTLIKFCAKYIDFTKKGAELLVIEDSRFVTLRLEHTYQRITKAQKALFKISQVEAAALAFFTLIKKPEYKEKRLAEHPKKGASVNTKSHPIRTIFTLLANLWKQFIRFIQSFFTKSAIETKPVVVLSPSPLSIAGQLNEPVQTYFTRVALNWQTCREFYLNSATEHSINEHNQAPLTHDPNTDRAHYLIKHTNYSKFISEFRLSLQQLTTLFNQAMQAELTIKPQGIPFPELQDPHLVATQSTQVVALKEIYNSLYYVEQIVLYLEELNDTCTKTSYMYVVAKAYYCSNELKKLVYHLSEDPHFKLIGTELLERAQTIWAALQAQLAPYQAPAKQIKPLDSTVSSPGLWYALNAFHVLPKHITS
jgi:hypothetical protein